MLGKGAHGKDECNSNDLKYSYTKSKLRADIHLDNHTFIYSGTARIIITSNGHR